MQLCNPQKYYEDPQLLIPTDRTPRPTEDIEVIGLVPIPEAIYLVSERNSVCKMTEISSITINFSNPSTSFTIYDVPGGVTVTGGSLHVVNSREPEPSRLAVLASTNALRYEHGWYTVNTGRAILNISTNARLVLENVGLTNNTISCNVFDIRNKSCYANGNINAPYLYIQDSFAYNVNTSVNTYVISTDSKVDNMYLQARTGYIFDSSVADSEMSHFSSFINGSKIIDSKLEYYYATIMNSKIQAQLYESESLLIEGLYVPMYRTDIRDTTILKNGIVQGTYISAGSVVLSGGTLQCYGLNGREGDLNIGESQEQRNIPVSVLAEGKLIATSVDTSTVSGLRTIKGTIEIGFIYNRFFGSDGPLLNINNNGGITDIGALAGTGYLNSIILSSYSGAKNVIHNNVLISGGYSNEGTIEGDFLQLRNFTNSGLIKVKSSQLTNSNNYGTINEAIFLSGAINHQSGIISKGIFKFNSINNGLVTQGSFTDMATNNGNVSNGTFSGSFTPGNFGPVMNNGFVDNGIFTTPLTIPINDNNRPIAFGMMDVVHNGSGNTIAVAGFAKNSGLVYKLLTVRNSGENFSINPVKIEFYDTSMNVAPITGQAIFKNSSKNHMGGGSGSIQNYYDNSSVQPRFALGYGSFLQTECNFYDYSFISGLGNTTSGEMNFYDFSTMYWGTIDSGTFYNSSKILNKGPVLANVLHFKDDSYCSGNVTVNASGIFFDNSSNKLRLLGSVAQFTNDSENIGTILTAATDFMDSATNIGLIQSEAISFQNSSVNKGTVQDGNRVIFTDSAVNNRAEGFFKEGVFFPTGGLGSLIMGVNQVAFLESATNFGGIIDFETASFFNNAKSYGSEAIGGRITNSQYKLINNLRQLDSFDSNTSIIRGENILFSGSINYAGLKCTTVTFNNAQNNAYVKYFLMDNNYNMFSMSGIPGTYAAIQGCGSVSFVSGSTNNEAIASCGSVTYNSSTNNGRLSDIGTISFDSSSNNASIYGTVSFSNYSNNNGFISGNVTFTNHSNNYGQISGTACFDNTSFNYGEVLDINCA